MRVSRHLFPVILAAIAAALLLLRTVAPLAQPTDGQPAATSPAVTLPAAPAAPPPAAPAVTPTDATDAPVPAEGPAPTLAPLPWTRPIAAPASPEGQEELARRQAEVRLRALVHAPRTRHSLDGLAAQAAPALEALRGALGELPQALEREHGFWSLERARASLDEAALARVEAALAALDAVSEDPITLHALARWMSARGDAVGARLLHERAIALHELNLYEDFHGTPHAEALILEHEESLEAARERWRASFHDNVLTAYALITRFSIDPERDALLEAARAHLMGLVEAARRGETPHLYTTSRGDSRVLERISAEAAMASFQAGERLRYVYIDALDLTGQTFEGRVGCILCVVGSIRGYDATFKDQFDFMGFVLGDVHLGKSWEGEVNRSRAIPAAQLNRLYLGGAVIFGDLNLESVVVTGRTANMPMMVVEGDADLRNATFMNTAELRYAHIRGQLGLKGAEFHGASYFGALHAGGLDLTRVTVHKSPLLFNSARFTGPVRIEKCELERGASFEDALFIDDALIHHCRIKDRLNFSRARFLGDALFSHSELTDIDFFGAEVRGAASLTDCVVEGNARFALDGLTRRQHLGDVHPLHRIYKQYQGDVDAEDDLTDASQYGVVGVDDLSAQFHGDVSFANTIFEKFVGFEGVVFGQPGEAQRLASFYNTQLYGEAHFERTIFHAMADFRTISGNELSFNGARFHAGWMLDDANVPGRLSLSGARLEDSATLSFYGARLAFFGVTFQQLLGSGGDSRLFYERCVLAGHDNLPFADDPRLRDARWDDNGEARIDDPEALRRRVRRACLERDIGEFVVLRDSFNKRGMTQESDWAYWHLRHYNNIRDRDEADNPLVWVGAWVQWLMFEKAFGWGVRLTNLLWTSLVVILFYMGMIWVLCGNMVIDWDDRTAPLRKLPGYVLFVVSLHSFLGRARDWKSRSSNKLWKILYTTEMILGIILITFFIGAYARIILR